MRWSLIGLFLLLVWVWTMPAGIVQAQTETPATPTRFPSPTPSPVPWPTPEADGRIFIIAAPGDSLITLADYYGVDASLLYAYNNLDPNAALLQIGQRLMIGIGPEYSGPGYIAGQAPGTGFKRWHGHPSGQSRRFTVEHCHHLWAVVGGFLGHEKWLGRLQIFLQIDQQIVVAKTPIPRDVGGSVE